MSQMILCGCYGRLRFCVVLSLLNYAPICVLYNVLDGSLEVEDEAHGIDYVLLCLAQLYAGEVLQHGGCPLARCGCELVMLNS